MFELVDIYNMVLAKRCDQEWEDQDSLEGAYETYNNLSKSKQSKFDKLVQKALKDCDGDFESFPEEHRTKLDMELHEETQNIIMGQLAKIFDEFI